MAASFKIVRGIKTNRVRGARSGARRRDPSPQRAINRGASWTVISISIPVEMLLAIDAEAERRGISRSWYMSSVSLAACGACTICGAIDPAPHDHVKHGLPMIGAKL